MKYPEISLLLGLSLVQILFSQAVPLMKNIVLHSNKNGTIQKSFHSETISGLVLRMNNGSYGLDDISRSVHVGDESPLEPRLRFSSISKVKIKSSSKKKNKNKRSKGKKKKKRRQKKNKKNKCSKGKKNKKKCLKKNNEESAGVEDSDQNTIIDSDHDQRATYVDSNIKNHGVGIRDHVVNSAVQSFLPSGGIPDSIPSLDEPDRIKDENYANDEGGNLYQEKDGIPDSLSTPDKSANMRKINNAVDQEGNSYREEK